MSTLYTAKVHVHGGRDGSVKSDDGHLNLKMAMPQAMGGKGAGVNPEQLFAAGYGSCFASTLKVIARTSGKPLGEVEVTAEVDVNLNDGAYDLSVRLLVKATGTDTATLKGLIESAKAACPYSRATRNNVTTTVTILG